MTLNSALRTVAIAFAATLSVAVTQAQSGRPIYVDIPFAYTVAGKTLPAGSYAVYAEPGRGYLVLRNQHDSKAVMMVAVNAAISKERKQQSSLTFNRYDDTYFLNQVWAGNGDSGVQLLPSKAEKEFIARSPNGVILAARKK